MSREMATRRRRPAQPVPGQQATPGPWRSLLTWVTSGRIVGLLLFVAATAGLGYVFTNARFSVQQIKVEGYQALDAETIVELAGIRGHSIWFVDQQDALARLKENAYIASASLTIALPDQATIQIIERRPEVRWQAGGIQYLVDASGKVLDAAQEPAENDVLVIIDTSHAQLSPNEHLDLDAIQLAQVLALRLPIELGFTPAQIGWDYGLGVYVRTTIGQTIVFGPSEDLERKLAILTLLLNEQTEFTYLDLRPATPFYQYRPEMLQAPATGEPEP